MLHPRFLLCLTLFATACGDERRPVGGPVGNPGGNDAGTQPPTGSACGNGLIDGFEICDEDAFANGGGTCSRYNLRNGDLRCTSSCTLDTSGCEVRDYCTANNLYGNGQCDPCDALGGMRDPDCDTLCGMDGTCADRFDGLVGAFTCRRLNKVDPDCGMCGNNVIDGNELCDGRAFSDNRITCSDYGFLGGDLGCNRDCTPNFGSCTFAVCGDGRREGREACDGTTTGAPGCEERGFAGGMLTCTSSCTISDTSCVRAGCMNGIIELARGEECEGTNLNGLTCTSRGFAGGTLACDGTCKYDQTACVAAGCNNGIIENNEQCEGTNLNGASCTGQGFLSGTLGCSNTSCTYDTSGCVAPGCGNNVIEPATEQCEGSDLAGGSCAAQGFAGGTLGCTMCRYDTSACVARGCGNGIIEAGNEQCEGSDLGGASCVSTGFLGGTLGCDSNCRFDTTQCTRGGCGNGIIEPATEQCEGTQLNGATCASQGYSGGTLACSMGCRFDTTQCTGGGAVCGDNRLQGLEYCDRNTFPAGLDRSCASLGLGTGTIGCSSSCRLDFSGCQNPDFCGAQMPSYYTDGACDVCQLGGGMRDSGDCGTSAANRGACGADGACVDYYFEPAYGYTCQIVSGARDPDCGCGNGFLEPATSGQPVIEQCDGNQSNYSMNCTDYGFTSGVVRCNASCGLDFGNCR